MGIQEVWHFSETSSDLFSEYVNFFLRLKQESSGWPSWVETPEDQARYIDDYYKHEGVLLRKEKIEKNPGLRALAKLCLNSLWGRFAMRVDRLMTEFISDPLLFYKRLNGADINMHDLCILNDDLVEVVFKRKHEYEKENKVTNIFIGIFTTAWARLELYKLMELLGENVLYVDTDSCIYLSKRGDPKPPLGDYLGDLTNEITSDHGPDTHITQFVCGGPKNYAYMVNDGGKHCKIRGFTLNFKNSQVLNFDSLKEIICKYVDRPVSVDIVNECKITREKWTRRLVNKREVKSYQVVYDKRIVLGKGEDTIPFGFHWSPSTTSSVATSLPMSVPDNVLFTLVQPSNENVAEQGDQMETSDSNADIMETSVSDIDNMVTYDIDLMETDDEMDNEYSSEDDSDRDFVNNEEMSDEISFYRRFNSNF